MLETSEPRPKKVDVQNLENILRIPTLSTFLFLTLIFFVTETFFNFGLQQKTSCQFFDILQQNGCKKCKRSLSYIFRQCELFKNLIFRFFFSGGSPFNFLIFCNRKDVENLKWSPLFIFFGTMRLTVQNSNFYSALLRRKSRLYHWLFLRQTK